MSSSLTAFVYKWLCMRSSDMLKPVTLTSSVRSWLVWMVLSVVVNILLKWVYYALLWAHEYALKLSSDASSGVYSVYLDVFPSPAANGIEFEFEFFESLTGENKAEFCIAHSWCKYLFFSRFRLLGWLRGTHCDLLMIGLNSYWTKNKTKTRRASGIL